MSRTRLPQLIAIGLMLQACGPKAPPLTVPTTHFGIVDVGQKGFVMTYAGKVHSIDAIDSGQMVVVEAADGVAYSFKTAYGYYFDEPPAPGTVVVAGFGTENVLLWLEVDGVRKAPLYKSTDGDIGCFVTTAVLATVGGPDDGPQLTAFRAFRDGYLLETPEGAEEVAEYYAIAPALVRRILQLPTSREVLACLYEDYLAPIHALIASGQHEAAHAAYRGMVRDLQLSFDAA